MVKVALFGQHEQLIVDVPDALGEITSLDGMVWVRDGTYYPPGSGSAGPHGPLPSRNPPMPQYRPRDL